MGEPSLSPSTVEITGVRRSPAGPPSLIELEAPAGEAGLRLAQSAQDTALHGVLLDGEPLVLVDGGRSEALVLSDHPALRGDVAPFLPCAPLAAFDEDEVAHALAPLVSRLASGLYTVRQSAIGSAIVAGPAVLEQPGLIDPGALAPEGGAPVALELGGGFFLLLGGRAALSAGAEALVVSGAFLLGGDQVEVRRHDLGAREGYARSPGHLFDERSWRDAVCAHQDHHPDVDLKRFSPDVLEPAAALSRAVLFDLTLLAAGLQLDAPARVAADGDPERGPIDEVAFVAPARWGGGPAVQIVLVTRDGRTLSEGRVSVGTRWETGLRPSPRALHKALLRLSEPGALARPRSGAASVDVLRAGADDPPSTPGEGSADHGDAA